MLITDELITDEMAAREHIAWCVSRGMTPNDVCESVAAYLTNPTWADASTIIKRRWRELQAGLRSFPRISDRVGTAGGATPIRSLPAAQKPRRIHPMAAARAAHRTHLAARS